MCYSFPGSSSESIIGISDLTENRQIWKMLLAEFLGTLLLVFIGCGSCISFNDESKGYVPYVQIGLTFGLTVATLAQVNSSF